MNCHATRVSAQVLELADKQDLGSCAFGREGSTPSLGTKTFLSSYRSSKRNKKVNLISPDDVSFGTLKVPQSDRLCLVAVRVKDYSRSLSSAEQSYAHSVSTTRREQYSSGRRAVQLGLSALNVSDVPVLLDDRKPDWPPLIVGSIAHTERLAVVLVGFKQDFRGVGIDILPKFSVSDKVRNRILQESELEIVRTVESKDLATVLFCAKESIYKAINPATDEFLGFRDVCVQIDELTTEFTAKTSSKKLSSELVASGRGYVFDIDHHWLTMFLIE